MNATTKPERPADAIDPDIVIIVRGLGAMNPPADLARTIRECAERTFKAEATAKASGK